MPDLEKIIIKTDSSDIDFLKVETSGQSNLCGYNAISNYIKFLPLNQRLECYKKLLSKVWSSHNALSSNPNPFAILTEELKYKLLFLEEFFKLRENELDGQELYLDEEENPISGEDQYYSNHVSIISLNQNIDQQNFAKAKRIFTEKYPDYPDKLAIQDLDYGIFFIEFYLTGGVLRLSDDGTQKVLLDDTYNQGYSFNHDRDHNIFSYQYNFLKTSYQNWVSFLMTIGYDTESYTDILNPVRIFNDLLPHNSFIILGTEANLGSGDATPDQKHYAIKNKYLESVYEYCEQYKSPDRQGVLVNQQFNFNRQFDLEDYKKILVSAYLQILKKFESASHQLDDSSNVEHNQQQSVFKIFRHFLLKQSYDDFFDENKNNIQEVCDQVFTHFFDMEDYRKTLISNQIITTKDVLDIIKSNNFTAIIDAGKRNEFAQFHQKYNQIKEIFKIVLEYFKKENSFERQYFHAINSDPLIVLNPIGVHYTSYIASTKIQNPFPEHDSLQTLYLQSLSTKDFKKEISQTLDHFINREANKLCLQSLSVRPDSASQFPLPPSIELSPSSSPTINIIQQNSSLFNKIAGRKDDNLRYRVSESELDNKPIHERISRAIDQAIDQSKLFISADGVTDAVTQKISDDEILLAMLLAKNFGGIGTKIDQIFSAERNHLDRERQALVNLLFNRKGDESKEINQVLFNKLVNFSANFQIKCKELGIYSGNKTIDERIFSNEQNIETRHGLRLAFIPDEFVLKYLNKPDISPVLKNIAKNLVAKKINQTRSQPCELVGR